MKNTPTTSVTYLHFCIFALALFGACCANDVDHVVPEASEPLEWLTNTPEWRGEAREIELLTATATAPAALAESCQKAKDFCGCKNNDELSQSLGEALKKFTTLTAGESTKDALSFTGAQIKVVPGLELKEGKVSVSCPAEKQGTITILAEFPQVQSLSTLVSTANVNGKDTTVSMEVTAKEFKAMAKVGVSYTIKKEPYKQQFQIEWSKDKEATIMPADSPNPPLSADIFGTAPFLGANIAPSTSWELQDGTLMGRITADVAFLPFQGVATPLLMKIAADLLGSATAPAAHHPSVGEGDPATTGPAAPAKTTMQDVQANLVADLERLHDDFHQDSVVPLDLEEVATAATASAKFELEPKSGDIIFSSAFGPQDDWISMIPGSEHVQLAPIFFKMAMREDGSFSVLLPCKVCYTSNPGNCKGAAGTMLGSGAVRWESNAAEEATKPFLTASMTTGPTGPTIGQIIETIAGKPAAQALPATVSDLTLGPIGKLDQESQPGFLLVYVPQEMSQFVVPSDSAASGSTTVRVELNPGVTLLGRAELFERDPSYVKLLVGSAADMVSGTDLVRASDTSFQLDFVKAQGVLDRGGTVDASTKSLVRLSWINSGLQVKTGFVEGLLFMVESVATPLKGAAPSRYAVTLRSWMKQISGGMQRLKSLVPAPLRDSIDFQMQNGMGPQPTGMPNYVMLSAKISPLHVVAQATAATLLPHGVAQATAAPPHGVAQATEAPPRNLHETVAPEEEEHLAEIEVMLLASIKSPSMVKTLSFTPAAPSDEEEEEEEEEAFDDHGENANTGLVAMFAINAKSFQQLAGIQQPDEDTHPTFRWLYSFLSEMRGVATISATSFMIPPNVVNFPEAFSKDDDGTFSTREIQQGLCMKAQAPLTRNCKPPAGEPEGKKMSLDRCSFLKLQEAEGASKDLAMEARNVVVTGCIAGIQNAEQNKVCLGFGNIPLWRKKVTEEDTTSFQGGVPGSDLVGKRLGKVVLFFEDVSGCFKWDPTEASMSAGIEANIVWRHTLSPGAGEQEFTFSGEIEVETKLGVVSLKVSASTGAELMHLGEANNQRMHVFNLQLGFGVGVAGGAPLLSMFKVGGALCVGSTHNCELMAAAAPNTYMQADRVKKSNEKAIERRQAHELDENEFSSSASDDILNLNMKEGIRVTIYAKGPNYGRKGTLKQKNAQGEWSVIVGEQGGKGAGSSDAPTYAAKDLAPYDLPCFVMKVYLGLDVLSGETYFYAALSRISVRSVLLAFGQGQDIIKKLPVWLGDISIEGIDPKGCDGAGGSKKQLEKCYAYASMGAGTKGIAISLGPDTLIKITPGLTVQGRINLFGASLGFALRIKMNLNVFNPGLSFSLKLDCPALHVGNDLAGFAIYKSKAEADQEGGGIKGPQIGVEVNLVAFPPKFEGSFKAYAKIGILLEAEIKAEVELFAIKFSATGNLLGGVLEASVSGELDIRSPVEADSTPQRLGSAAGLRFQLSLGNPMELITRAAKEIAATFQPVLDRAKEAMNSAVNFAKSTMNKIQAELKDRANNVCYQRDQLKAKLDECNRREDERVANKNMIARVVSSVTKPISACGKEQNQYNLKNAACGATQAAKNIHGAMASVVSGTIAGLSKLKTKLDLIVKSGEMKLNQAMAKLRAQTETFTRHLAIPKITGLEFNVAIGELQNTEVALKVNFIQPDGTEGSQHLLKFDLKFIKTSKDLFAKLIAQHWFAKQSGQTMKGPAQDQLTNAETVQEELTGPVDHAASELHTEAKRAEEELIALIAQMDAL